MYLFGRFLFMMITTVLFTGCAFLGGMQKRSAVCDYDRAWESALDTVKDRSVSTKDKDAGLIVTDWLEIPMPGRVYGIFRRDMGDNKDRSRVTLHVKRLDDVTQTRIEFIEERQSWVFRGGSRLFGWASTDPSEDVMRDLQDRLDTKLKERGCSLTSL
jgi:hypothetical protein